MATATDSSAALEAFQREVDWLPLTPIATEPGVFFHLDEPLGTARLAFAKLQGRTVTALATFFAAAPIDGVMVFHGFYAVPEAYRNQGQAKDIVRSALRQISQGIGQTGVDAIRVVLLVDAENTVAQRVAAAVVSATPSPVTDEATGRPALLYAADNRAPARQVTPARPRG
jgi:RimJ/RimL family protein N-acetyltransferase